MSIAPSEDDEQVKRRLKQPSIFGPMLFLTTIVCSVIGIIITLTLQQYKHIDQSIESGKFEALKNVSKAIRREAKIAQSKTAVQDGSCPVGTEQRMLGVNGIFQCLVPCREGFESVAYTAPDDVDQVNTRWFCRATCPEGKDVSGQKNVCSRAFRDRKGDGNSYGRGPNIVLCDKDSSPGGNYNSKTIKHHGDESKCYHHYRNYTRWEENTVVGCAGNYERIPTRDVPTNPFAGDYDHDTYDGKKLEIPPTRPQYRCVENCPENMRPVGKLSSGICAEECPPNTKNVFDLSPGLCIKDAYVQTVVNPYDVLPED